MLEGRQNVKREEGMLEGRKELKKKGKTGGMKRMHK